MRRMLRVLVTGQTPRLDVLTRLSLAASDHDIRIEGALDDMGSDQIVRHMAPRSDADALRVKLSSGHATRVSRMMVADRLSAKLPASGPTLFWSTASFPEVRRRDDLVRPGDLLTAMVDVLVSRGTLGVIVPHAEMLIRQPKERSRPGVCVAITALAPGSDQAAVDAAAFQHVAQQPDLVLMDCMSYSRAEMTRVATVLSCLVLLPQSLPPGPS